MISKILSFDWALWFFWIMATTLGWLLGGLILPGLALVTSGILVGIFQWLVLQGRILRPWRWIVVTSLGWIVGYLVAFFALPANPDAINAPMDLVNSFRLASGATMTAFWVVLGAIFGALWDKTKPHETARIKAL